MLAAERGAAGAVGIGIGVGVLSQLISRDVPGEADRRAAEYALSVGATLTIIERSEGQERRLWPGNDVPNEDLDALLTDFQVETPWARVTSNVRAFQEAFNVRDVPAIILLDKEGRVQSIESGADPMLEENLTQKVKDLLAGEDLAALHRIDYQGTGYRPVAGPRKIREA